MNADKMVVIYESGVPTAILTRAFNIVVISEVNAESYMEFDIYFTDEKHRCGNVRTCLYQVYGRFVFYLL